MFKITKECLPCFNDKGGIDNNNDKTNINNINNNNGGDENNKNTEDHSVLEVPCPKKGTIYKKDF